MGAIRRQNIQEKLIYSTEQGHHFAVQQQQQPNYSCMFEPDSPHLQTTYNSNFISSAMNPMHMRYNHASGLRFHEHELTSTETPDRTQEPYSFLMQPGKDIHLMEHLQKLNDSLEKENSYLRELADTI